MLNCCGFRRCHNCCKKDWFHVASSPLKFAYLLQRHKESMQFLVQDMWTNGKILRKPIFSMENNRTNDDDDVKDEERGGDKRAQTLTVYRHCVHSACTTQSKCSKLRPRIQYSKRFEILKQEIWTKFQVGFYQILESSHRVFDI